MTLTPLHVAFIWLLKPKFRSLPFAAMTIGAFVPDLEPLVSWIFGWSVFCGWDFPCTLSPDRLILHSIVGAVTIDVLFTMVFVKLIDKFIKPERVGIHGFHNVKVLNSGFYASAALGSLSHVLVDWLHHPANPVFWPFAIGQPASSISPYYVDGLLLPFVSVLLASLIVAIISATIIVILTKKALNACGHSFWLALSDPMKTISITTAWLSKET